MANDLDKQLAQRAIDWSDCMFSEKTDPQYVQALAGALDAVLYQRGVYELVSAARDALHCLEDSQPTEGGRTWQVCEQLRAAISKANGDA